MNSLIFIFLPILLSVILVFSANAQDLTIEDNQRLIRVLADQKTPQSVEVELSQPAQSLSLENLDGLQQKIMAVNLGGNKYIFNEVVAGSWRIKVKPRELVVLNVSVTKE